MDNPSAEKAVSLTDGKRIFALQVLHKKLCSPCATSNSVYKFMQQTGIISGLRQSGLISVFFQKNENVGHLVSAYQLTPYHSS